MKKALAALLRAWLFPLGLLGLIRALSVGWNVYPALLDGARVLVFPLILLLFIVIIFTFGETMTFLRAFFGYVRGEEDERYVSFFSKARKSIPLISGVWTYAAFPLIEALCGVALCALCAPLLRAWAAGAAENMKLIKEFALFAAAGLYLAVDGIYLFATRNRWD